MKYLSIVFFLVLMKFTWVLAYKSPAISIETHQLIQTELKDIVYQVLTKYRPLATNLQFQSIWTERISDTQVKAHFTYSFIETDAEEGESVEQTQDGDVTLNQITPDAGWSLDEVTVSRQALQFKKGIVISPSSK